MMWSLLARGLGPIGGALTFRWRDLLFLAQIVALEICKRLGDGVDVIVISAATVHANRSLDKRVWQERADLFFGNANGLFIIPIMKEAHAVHRVAMLFAVVNLQILHDDVVRFQAAGNVICALTSGDVRRKYGLEICDALFGHGVLVHKAIEFASANATHDVARLAQRRFVAVLNLLQQRIVHLDEFFDVPNRVTNFTIPRRISFDESVDNHVFHRLCFFVRVHALMHRRARVKQ
mmetsp:Transcript_80/g.341  ORF Transcript_80/g.341 Transcript_80/m.341 type:complete len:235 (+) Transcript_80:106-810(+)